MPKQVDHEQRREEICRGVFQVIAQSGLPAVSLRSVAAAADVSMGRVQHYFTDKDDMVHHACRLFVHRAQERYELAAEAPPQDRELHLLAMGLPSSEEARRGSAIWYAFVVGAVTDPVLAEIIRQAWEGMARALHHGYREGDGDPQRTAAQVEVLSALVDGLTLRVMLGRITGEQARQILGRQLGPRPGPER